MTEKIRGMSIGLDMSTIGIERSLTAIKNSFREVKHAAKVNLNNIKFDTKSVDGYKRNLDQLNDAFKMQKRNVGELKRELDKLEETGKGNTKEAQDLRNEINKQTDEMNRLERAVESTTKELQKMELAQKGAGWTKFGEGFTDFSDKFKKAGQSMKDTGSKMTAAITLPLVGLGGGAIKAATEFESAFAGVKKTVDMSESGFEALETSIRDMSKELPFAATEIAGVAESAGQLGIQNENIEGFTKTILDMSVATNLSTEQAANDFARFANIVQMPQENFDRLGSSVVALGNNLATSESEIVSMGMRLAGIGAQVGLTEAEIMALAAAMSSVGTEAEAGGSSMTTVMKKIQNAVSAGGADLELFAQASGMSASDFAAQWESSPITALDSFIKGLSKSGESGENLNAILGDLGIKGIRETDTLLRMAGASDILSEAVDLSTNAWEKNTALSEEAAVRYETMASKIQIMKNRLMDLGIEIGEILMPIFSNMLDKIGEGIDWFSRLSDKTKENIVQWGLYAVAAGPVLMAIGNMSLGISAILSPIGKLLTLIGGGGGLVPALKIFGAKIVSNLAILGPWAAGIGLVVGASALFVKHLSQEAVPAVNDFGDEVSNETTEAVTSFMDMADGAAAELDRLFYSGQIITEEGASELTKQFDSMFETIKTSMSESFEEDKKILSEFFAESNAMSIGHEREIIKKMEEGYEERQTKVQEKQDKINEIIQGALEEERELTYTERTRIAGIEKEIREQAIEELSANEQEQLIIKEKMSQEKGAIDARTAADTVKRSAEAREGVIDEANQQYEGVIAAVAYQRDVTGAISAAEAEVLIADAEKIRDESIAAANKTHEDVVDAAKKQAKEHVDEVDWETGEVLTKWDQLKNTMSENWSQITEAWDKFWNGNREGLKKHHEEQRKERDRANEEAMKGLSEWWQGFKTRRSEQWSEMTNMHGEFWSGIVSGLKESHKEQKEERDKANEQMKQDISEAWKSVQTNLSGWWNSIKTNFKTWLNDKLTEFNTFRTNLSKYFSDLWASLTTNLSTWWNNILNNFKTWLNNKTTEFNKFRANLSKFFSDLWTTLTKNLSGWWNNIASNFSTWLNNKIKSVSSFGGNLRKSFSDIWTSVTNSMSSAWDGIKRKYDGFLDGLVSGARNIGKGLRNAFASAFNSGIGSVSKGVNKIIDGINWVLGKLGVGDSKIGKWNFVPIPQYAKGTKAHPGGAAIVGDGGMKELIMTPKGDTYMSPATDTLVDLPKGTQVLSGPNTRKLMDELQIPEYKNGIGEQIKDMGSQIWNWMSGGAKNVLDKAIGMVGGGQAEGPGIFKPIAKGAISMIKNAAASYLESKMSAMMPDGGWHFPGMTFTSGFGQRWGRMHEGIDMAAPSGTPIPSQSGGVVTGVGYRPQNSGNYVDVKQGAWSYHYYHMLRQMVKRGQEVTRGQILGLVGSTGRSTGPHLHFEVRKNGRAIDPMSLGGAGGGGGGGGNSGMGQWTSVAAQALRMTGQYSANNLSRLLMQMKSESGGNARAINNWDSNARRGTPSKGLMQVIDPTFRAYRMPGYNNIWNPLDNILASIRYSVSRYGSLSRAWRGVGYATGGLINEEGLYRLAEDGHPEFVIPTDPARRTDAMKLLALAGKRIQGSSNKRPNELSSPASNNQEVSGGDTYHIHITANGDLPASTIRKMADRIEEEIKKKQDRKRMSKGEGVSFA